MSAGISPARGEFVYRAGTTAIERAGGEHA